MTFDFLIIEFSRNILLKIYVSNIKITFFYNNKSGNKRNFEL